MQLVQLQNQYDRIKKAGGDVVAVLREDMLGAGGLKRMAEKTGAAFTLLDDPAAKQTAPYSHKGFATYIIDSGGVIRETFSGTKTKRPTGKEIAAAIEAIIKTDATKEK